jgi:hypothetical protein
MTATVQVFVLSAGVRDAEENVGVFSSFPAAERAAEKTGFWDPDIPPRSQPTDHAWRQRGTCWLGGRGGDTILIQEFKVDA